MDTASLSKLYKSELLENVIPFWERNSLDREFGGYYTCLDRYGRVFDTDKFMWLQGRQVWMFSTLFNSVEKRSSWLDIALHGAEFMKKYGRDNEGNWYFALTREGKPLVQPYNIFSDCFATMAFGQLHRATGRDEYGDVAKQTFSSILKRFDNPKGKYSKQFPGTRPLKNFALPMIISNLALEIEPLLEPQLIEEVIGHCIHEVMEVFYDSESGLILENVSSDGQFSDSFEGRLLNPGHAIEAMWFIMNLAERGNNSSLLAKAVDTTIKVLEYGWDEKYEGIFYFLDIKGNPPQQLEWDQKLWWVHIETLVALVKGYYYTGNPKCAEWFDRVHRYTWSHFPDPEFGEWFGYLNRQGEVLLPLKGGKWKGCFHVPRGLFHIWQTIELLDRKRKANEQK
jgi:N-acylglucosamine 2-epimerase